MKNQMTKITMILVLVIGLAGAALAQNEGVVDGIAPVAGNYTGTETSPGNCDAIEGMCSGNLFVMNSDGDRENNTLVLFLKYSMNAIVPNNYVVTGGSWSLIVVRDNRYAGTLHGEILSGDIVLVQGEEAEPSSKNVRLNLASVSGFGIFDGKASVNIGGIYNATTDLKTKETTGTASFGF